MESKSDGDYDACCRGCRMKTTFSAWLESWLPLVLAALVLAGTIGGLFYLRVETPSTFGDLLGAVINVSAIGAGFLATAKSILFSIQNSQVVLRLKSGGQYEVFVGYFMTAINASLAVALW